MVNDILSDDNIQNWIKTGRLISDEQLQASLAIVFPCISPTAPNTHIYRLVDPRTNLPRYVGKTIKPLNLRLSEHLSSARRKRVNFSPREVWLKELIAAKMKPRIESIEFVAPELASTSEAFWINKLLAEGAPLVNQQEVRPTKKPVNLRLL